MWISFACTSGLLTTYSVHVVLIASANRPRRLSTKQPVESAGRNGFAARTLLTWGTRTRYLWPSASETDHERAWRQSLSALDPRTLHPPGPRPGRQAPGG